MTDQQEERLVRAIEMLASSMTTIAGTMALTYQQQFPPRRAPQDISITRPLSPEDKLRQEQGATGEPTTEAWMDLENDQEEIGPYQQKFIDAERDRKAQSTEARPAIPWRPTKPAGA